MNPSFLPANSARKSGWKSISLPAAALPLALTISILLLLGVFALIALLDGERLFLSRLNYIKTQREYINSAFLLYRLDSTLAERIETDPSVTLFGSDPASALRIRSERWGLYEAVTITDRTGALRETRMLGNARPWTENCNFYYPDRNTRLTLAGRCALKGPLLLPRDGLLYGQMDAEFYSGETPGASSIRPATEHLPAPTEHNLSAAAAVLDLLRESEYAGTAAGLPADSPALLLFPPEAALAEAVPAESAPVENLYRSVSQRQPSIQTVLQEFPDSLHCGFGTPAAASVHSSAPFPERKSLSGKMILLGEHIYLDSMSRTDNILVAARTIRIGKNFRGSAQFFALDTILLEEGAELRYPSGLYLDGNNPERYLEIGPECRINGYIIVNGREEARIRTPNYRQSARATVRGLVYIRGTALLQGIVSGSVFLERAVYYSSGGYYDHTLYNASVLPNPFFACPHWLETPYIKKEIGRI